MYHPRHRNGGEPFDRAFESEVERAVAAEIRPAIIPTIEARLPFMAGSD